MNIIKHKRAKVNLKTDSIYLGVYYSKVIGHLKKFSFDCRSLFFFSQRSLLGFFSSRKWVSFGSLFQNCKVSLRIGSSAVGLFGNTYKLTCQAIL